MNRSYWLLVRGTPFCRLLLCSLFLLQQITSLHAAETPNTDSGRTLQLGPRSGNTLQIVGPDGRLQLLVTSTGTDNIPKDRSRAAQYEIQPEGIIRVDDTGLVTPLKDGNALVTARDGDQTATISVTVSDFAATRIVDFQNQIIPLFTKHGCNGGGCHGKAAGQNGFKLSLLGFYPDDDFEYLVKEGRSRRIFPAMPERSLVITKATGEVPHGGGKRVEIDSQEYRTLLRWIEQGCPRSAGENTPVITGIECYPPTATLREGESQQIAVYAAYSDGSFEDVTRTTLFEPNNPELAECSTTGLVTALDLSGEVAIMARYQGLVSTFRATIPMQSNGFPVPPARNIVDETVFNKLQALGIPPSIPCDDATFIRRVSLDITGRLPTADRVRTFLDDTRADKRDLLIDELLDSPEYADYFANKWNMILRNKGRQDPDREGTYRFHQWIWSSIYENKPFNQFVKEIVTASGAPDKTPEVTWYREVSTVEQQAEDAAQLFLGVRVQCARCHHHPYDRWSQEDYYGLAAFFSRIGKKELGAESVKAIRDRRIFHNDGIAQLPHPRSGKQVRPAGLGGPTLDIPADRDPRFALADWMTSADNHYFSRTLVNRYWKHFFSRGLVEPEDDLRDTNPPSNPELMDGLAKSFIESGYDLKELIRTICRSTTYQLSSSPNEQNARDKQNFSRYYPKRLTAESLYDAFHQVTLTKGDFRGVPAGSEALQLPDTSVAPYFLKVFGQPQADSACECERAQSANLAQSLHMLNSQEIQTKITQPTGRAHLLAQKQDQSHEERLKELYLWTFSRLPDADELKTGLAHINKNKDNVPIAYEDIVWALINTKEFQFNH
ncbi:DUF1549 domain-containing protein [Planctomicrobium sp. SH527]|uniref:DUF1549 domain-containing protein n=1 Tax=Planctomicrobium sp. SH527 TaxID=3448123 RepID=UPI003F5C785D